MTADLTLTNELHWTFDDALGTNALDEFFRANDADGFTETVKARAALTYPAANALFMKLAVWLQQVPAP